LRRHRSDFGRIGEASADALARGVKTARASLSIYLGITVLAAMLTIEIEREEDGRWIGEVPAHPGVLAYGKTEGEARARAIALALRVIADRIDRGEPMPDEARSVFAA
jgi:predicted RNase H-like HicB family nuclease